MQRCIQLAMNGRQNARPNPMVGAVIVSDDGTIIGEGYHIRHGEGHAEVNAFASVRPEHQHLLPKSTLYVSLEPCSHFGKTPPCADLIIRRGVKRVVVGCVDPFAQVQGRGIQRLRDAGIEVTVGVCEEECRELNKVFFTFHRFHRPFITLKWAESADHFIGGLDAEGRPTPAAISSVYTQMLCHKLRAEHQAILVGHTTWTTDHPSLTTRQWYGPNPLRVILANEPAIQSSANNLTDAGTDVTAPDTILQKGPISSVLSALHRRGIQSLLVEGGARVLRQFIDTGLWDEAFVEHGTICLNNGTPAPQMPTVVNPTSEPVIRCGEKGPDTIHSYLKTFFGRTITHYVNTHKKTILQTIG